MTTISGGSEPQFSIGGLINVPDHLRKLDEQAFTPLLISIGPIHRSNAKLQTMNECKERFRDSFIQRANIDLDYLKDTIRGREDEIRSYYAETIVSSISSDDFVTMIVVDGVFILEYILKQSDPRSVVNDPMIADWMPPFLKFDLVLLENQLPFLVLEMLFEQANFPAESGIQPLRELATKFLENDLLPKRIFGGAKLSYSAIQLHGAGVKFKGLKFDEGTGFYGQEKRLLGISFDFKNGVLEIPCIELNVEKIRLIRNIIALEQSNYVGDAYVTDFFGFLDFLINSSRDVDLLCDKEILVNYLRDSNTATSVVNSLNSSIFWAIMLTIIQGTMTYEDSPRRLEYRFCNHPLCIPWPGCNASSCKLHFQIASTSAWTGTLRFTA
ncbi:hypothetical protein SO802_022748 [Lithocarpus litseifolius]|uniref:Uncharacterized protein n=1 Tax=Lithocarpus litseifolius TaxID=425828 RepID=A0AAW2C9U5_9ROSI